MKLKLDRGSREVQPRTVGDRVGSRARADVEVKETPDGLTLKPVRSRPSRIKKERGLLVYTGKVPPGFDAARAVEEDRDERIRKSAHR